MTYPVLMELASRREVEMAALARGARTHRPTVTRRRTGARRRGRLALRMLGSRA